MSMFKTISLLTPISIPEETQHQSFLFVISQQQAAAGATQIREKVMFSNACLKVESGCALNQAPQTSCRLVQGNRRGSVQLGCE